MYNACLECAHKTVNVHTIKKIVHTRPFLVHICAAMLSGYQTPSQLALESSADRRACRLYSHDPWADPAALCATHFCPSLTRTTHFGPLLLAIQTAG